MAAPVANMAPSQELPGMVSMPTNETFNHLSNQISGFHKQQAHIVQEQEVARSDREILTKRVDGLHDELDASKEQFDCHRQKTDRRSQVIDDTLKDFGEFQSMYTQKQKQVIERVKWLEGGLLTTNLHQQALAQAASLITNVLRPTISGVTKTDSTVDSPDEGEIPETITPPLSSSTAHRDVNPLLKLLRKMDFTNAKHSKALRDIEDVPFALSMFHESEKFENEAIAYTVRGRGAFASCLVACDRRVPTKVSGFQNSIDWEDRPRIIEFHDHCKAAALGNPALPKYVWEIGEVYVRRRTIKRNNQWTEQSTGYHLVVDVTTLAKSVWMVYRYAEQGGDGRIERDVTRSKETFFHPFSSINNECFDAAQVFADIHDWHGGDTPVGQFRKAAMMVKSTGRNLQPVPTFIEPVWFEAKRVMENGWLPRQSRSSSHRGEGILGRIETCRKESNEGRLAWTLCRSDSD